MRLFGLTGNPLEHSFSKQYFDRKFLEEGMKGCRYELFLVPDAQSIRQLAETSPDLAGLNVTIPFKQTVIQLLDATDATAAKIGAVNCIRISRKHGKPFLTGYNTDAAAFRKTLLSLLKPHHQKALILGTGGAAQAVKYALDELEIRSEFVSRKKESSYLSYESLTKEIIEENLIIVNTTPLGMFPNVEICPEIPYHYLSDKHLLYDLVYNPELTLFLRKGKELDATVKNGLEMLHLQAELAWQIWNGND
jgi:shikimate dehydrogenase